ncbi:Putative ribonuclease H protein At1g65750 [Linum perenne]
MPLTQDLGCYLGVPILHSRTTIGTNQCILDKLNKKLSGWKEKSLSLTGRVTLARAALKAIPAYFMQTCQQAKSGRFTWLAGSISVNLKQGGLGLRLARHLNTAYMV